MISKIFICRCYKEEFEASGNTYMEKHIPFHCKCKEKQHFYYGLFWEKHPFGADFDGWTRKKIANFGGRETEKKSCSCKAGFSHEVCDFCITVRYLLNFKCFKICVEEVPDYFIERAISLNYYFKKIKCETFFFTVKSQMRLR